MSRLSAMLIAALTLLIAVPATAQAADDYPALAAGNGRVSSLTRAGDGNLWFGQRFQGAPDKAQRIGKVDASGTVTEYAVPSYQDPQHPGDPDYTTGMNGINAIAAGPDGNVWFVGATSGFGFPYLKVGRVTPQGVVTRFALPNNANVNLNHLVSWKGALWASSGSSDNALVRIDPATGSMTVYRNVVGTSVSSLVVGPRGNVAGDALWFTDSIGERIGIVTLDGPGQTPVVGFHAVPDLPSGNGLTPFGLVVGADGNVWGTVSEHEAQFQGVHLNGFLVRYDATGNLAFRSSAIPLANGQPALVQQLEATTAGFWMTDTSGASVLRADLNGTIGAPLTLANGQQPGALAVSAGGLLHVGLGGSAALLRTAAGGTPVASVDPIVTPPTTPAPTGETPAATPPATVQPVPVIQPIVVPPMAGTVRINGVTYFSTANAAGAFGQVNFTCVSTGYNCATTITATSAAGAPTPARAKPKPVTVFNKVVRLKSGQKSKLTLVLNAKGKALLKKQGRLKVTIVTTTKSATGAVTKTTKVITVKAAPPRRPKAAER